AVGAAVCPSGWMSYGSYCYELSTVLAGPFKRREPHVRTLAATCCGRRRRRNWTGRLQAVADTGALGRCNWGSVATAARRIGWIGGRSDCSDSQQSSDLIWLMDGSPLVVPWQAQTESNDFVSLTKHEPHPGLGRILKTDKKFPMQDEFSNSEREAFLKASATFWSRDPTEESHEAVSDCRRRDPSAHLLWVTSQAEMDWVMDFSDRNWSLKKTTELSAETAGFKGDAAWTGLYRDEADGGNFKWLKDNSNVDVTVKWFVLDPGNPPRNYAYIYGTTNDLYFRTYSPEAKHYHFCKAPVFVSTTAPTEGLPSQNWLQFSGFCYLLVKGSNGRNLTEACLTVRDETHLLTSLGHVSSRDGLGDGLLSKKLETQKDYRAQCRDCRNWEMPPGPDCTETRQTREFQ
uniref:C-type lectin domain-containing protein n=1 Tax=Macrostomum lignano TaxID=282301 RepID=A0A1I8FKE8_9PLAT